MHENNVKKTFFYLSPDAKVIIFSTPTPVGVWESIHLKKVLFGQCCDSSKVAFVTQPESRIKIY